MKRHGLDAVDHSVDVERRVIRKISACNNIQVGIGVIDIGIYIENRSIQRTIQLYIPVLIPVVSKAANVACEFCIDAVWRNTFSVESEISCYVTKLFRLSYYAAQP